MKNVKSAALSGAKKRVSLSSYFPRGTHYFYSYPTGEDSHYLNNVPPVTDELVAARALSCAGPEVSVVSFAATATPCIDDDLIEKLAIPKISDEHLTVLPSSIDIDLRGKERNEAIMTALAKNVSPRSLVMAQPFASKKMESLYEIAPDITIWLNDKSNMAHYISEEMMPARFAEYSSGAACYEDTELPQRDGIIPCVVKVASSSSGDGVYICTSLDDLRAAQQSVQAIDVNVFVEQYVTAVKNYAIHFGIPHNREKPIDIIGYNEQLTTDDGEFLGGIITQDDFPPVLDEVRHYLLEDVLPTARARGWYGVGGYDVIIDENGRPYLIDGNFRMTGMSACHFLIANGVINKPMVSFGGHFSGTREDFDAAVLPHAMKESPVQLIALSRHDDEWHFNGALMYSSSEELSHTIDTLLDAGIVSPALEQLRLASI